MPPAHVRRRSPSLPPTRAPCSLPRPPLLPMRIPKADGASATSTLFTKDIVAALVVSLLLPHGHPLHKLMLYKGVATVTHEKLHM
ncbi:hypothetical protein E2562_028796 [Oryza meyeriana var. granulata]|uniref:Uncharacterized protein n=1 Tax=Oryza meyeriana var. granulata TaxID=110450 RepID=A0A6G1EE31_9ORYZ|nr:hypothetical protein E2562_028796 [Oryza meyeriana var. granulata]